MKFIYIRVRQDLKQLLERVDWRHSHIHTIGPAAVAVLLVMVFGVLQLLRQDFYSLDKASQTVVGPVNAELTKKLSFDKGKQLYRYNKEAVTQDNPDSPQAALAAAQKNQKVGGGAKNYAVDLAADSKKGVTIHDTTDSSGSLGISLTPLFETRDGKLSEGRVVYPLKGIDGKLVYTVKANGLKEDLVLATAQTDELSFSYRLKLPNNLEARLLSSGALGIYSADPALFGNISFGSDADRAKVEAARQNSAKNHLVFAIPAPEIVQSGKGSSAVKAQFELDDDVLTVRASGLAKASYPLSIDPSVVVTSANDLLLGNVEGDGIEFDTGNNQLKRSALTGGSVTTWTDVTQTMGQRKAHASVVYNDKLYVIAGCDTFSGLASFGCTSVRSDVGYATLNGDGTLSAFTAVNSIPQARTGHAAVAYNGYMYVISGFNSDGQTGTNSVYYAKINSDGTLGSWNLTSAILDGIGNIAATAYNGYIYMGGGNNGAFETNRVTYAAVKADGTLGTWTDTNDFTTQRFSHTMTVYNGYIYATGGCTNAAGSSNCSAYTNSVQYAPLNSDGTVGTWVAGTNLPSVRMGHASVAYGGYLYMMGGCSVGASTCSTFHNDVQYVPINADGSIGSWSVGPIFAGTARAFMTGVAHKGYLYLNGGISSSGQGGGNSINNTNSGPIDPAGVTGAYSTSGNTFANASYGISVVAYDSYLYVIGGCSAGNCTTVENKVRYAPIADDGTIGTFTTSGNNLVGARYGHASFVYNGRLYVVGGCSSTTSTCSTFSNSIQYSGTITSGNPGVWTDDTTNPFTTGRFWHSAMVNNGGIIYVLGGCSAGDCTNYLNDVQYATINSGGDVGSFTNFGNFDSTGRYKISAVTHGNYLYVTGGYDGTNFKQDVRYAALNNDGSLNGSWADGGNNFTTARAGHTAVVRNGYLYIVGGCSTGASCSAFQADTQYAPLNNNGTVGSWAVTTSFSTGRFGQGATVYNDRLYVAGGCSTGNCTSFRNDVQIAPINNGGPGKTWDWGSVTSLPAARNTGAAVAYNGYLYAVGGSNNTNLVEYAPINSNGTLGSWTATTNFTTARTRPVVAVYKGYMYVAGGTNAGGTNLNDVQYAPINANGTLGTWNPTTSFPTARLSTAGTIANGYLYIAGGCTSYDGLANTCNTFANDVQYAPINANGTIGSWNSTTSFTTARFGHRVVAISGYLYVMGGCSAFSVLTCNGYLNTVQYAPINANGTLGAWNTTTSFAGGRYDYGATIMNGFMYVLGGIRTGAITNNVQYAAINSNGTLGAWNDTKSFTTSSWGRGTTAYNGYLYVVGGNGGSDLSEVQYAGQQAIPRVGRYSYLIDLAGDATVTKLIYRGSVAAGSRMVLGGRTATSSSTVFGSTNSFLDVAPETLATFSATEARYRWLTFTFDDSASAVFPDSSSSRTTLGDFELYSHAAPSKRLRGGKTFTDQTQRGLDAQPN